MPKVNVHFSDNQNDGSKMINFLHVGPPRKVYLGTVSADEYEALRVHFVSEFLAQPVEKSFSELDTIYGHV